MPRARTAVPHADTWTVFSSITTEAVSDAICCSCSRCDAWKDCRRSWFSFWTTIRACSVCIRWSWTLVFRWFCSCSSSGKDEVQPAT